MPEDHRHCVVCGRAIELDKFFCSPSCEDIFKKQRKRMVYNRLILMVVFIAIFLLILFSA
ncbi:MAG: DUF2116 family Zn-ribbon domain-containing protein [Candidatus Hadarchaeaceae archaeon]